jgi:hypothetical protein
MFQHLFSKMKKEKKCISENIFRLIKRDIDCINLQKLCFQKCIYDKDDEKKIFKHFSNNNTQVLEWENVVYLYLLDKNITAPVTIRNNHIQYDTSNKISVYEYLTSKKKYNTKLLLNELFGFISKFREFNYLHGNLHIYNIFVNKDTLKFCVIDFSNSFLIDKITTPTLTPKYQRTSYLGEMDIKITSIFFEYWDFFTLYISLKNIITDSYLENLIRYYVKQDVLQRFQDEYEKYKKTNILVYHLDAPTIVEM